MLCRKQLVLEAMNDSILTYNYQYQLMKFIYVSVTKMDNLLGELLHESGFIAENKKFKLFNFALLFSNAEFSKEGIGLCNGLTLKLVVSGKDEIVNVILKSLQSMSIINLYDTRLKITGTFDDKSVNFKRQMLYKVYSPIIESIFNGEKIQMLSPFEDDFYRTLAQNLKRKYKLIYNKDYSGEIFFHIENLLNVKEKYLHGIKGSYSAKGFGKYNLWIEADIDMQRVAYFCGLGQRNAMGAGFLGYITGR